MFRPFNSRESLALPGKPGALCTLLDSKFVCIGVEVSAGRQTQHLLQIYELGKGQNECHLRFQFQFESKIVKLIDSKRALYVQT